MLKSPKKQKIILRKTRKYIGIAASDIHINTHTNKVKALFPTPLSFMTEEMSGRERKQAARRPPFCSGDGPSWCRSGPADAPAAGTAG